MHAAEGAGVDRILRIVHHVEVDRTEVLRQVELALHEVPVQHFQDVDLRPQGSVDDGLLVGAETMKFHVVLKGGDVVLNGAHVGDLLEVDVRQPRPG